MHTKSGYIHDPAHPLLKSNRNVFAMPKLVFSSSVSIRNVSCCMTGSLAFIAENIITLVYTVMPG